MERALLTRHAESQASVEGLTNGDPLRDVPLTEAGREQARALGLRLASEELDLCVVTEFRRTQETADIALEGRGVTRLVLPALNDIRFGDYEGRLLADYRVWARAHGPEDVVPGGDESRADASAGTHGPFASCSSGRSRRSSSSRTASRSATRSTPPGAARCGRRSRRFPTRSRFRSTPTSSPRGRAPRGLGDAPEWLI